MKSTIIWLLVTAYDPDCSQCCGEIIEAKHGERFHAEIVSRIGEDAVEGYTYSPNAALCDPAHGNAGKPETL